jgi:hypothetical protein
LDPEVVTLLQDHPVVTDLKTLVLDLLEKIIHDLLLELVHVRLLNNYSSGSSFCLVGFSLLTKACEVSFSLILISG